MPLTSEPLQRLTVSSAGRLSAVVFCRYCLHQMEPRPSIVPLPAMRRPGSLDRVMSEGGVPMRWGLGLTINEPSTWKRKEGEEEVGGGGRGM